MKIYVAGASAQIALIEGFIARLRGAGHEITFDWTVAVREAGSASPDDAAVRRHAAEADLGGVDRCELYWLIKPDASNPSTGAWVELGSALTLKRLRETRQPVTVASGASQKCIFADLCDHNFMEHEDAFAFISDMHPS